MFQQILSYIHGDKHFQPEAVSTEIVMADGTKQRVSPGDTIETKSGKTYGVNSRGVPFLINDPSFIQERIPDDHPDQKVRHILGVAGLALAIVIVGVIVMLIVAGVTS